MLDLGWASEKAEVVVQVFLTASTQLIPCAYKQVESGSGVTMDKEFVDPSKHTIYK